jgi:hypothetical protein
MGGDDPTRSNLDVYATKAGLWNPDHGDLELPTEWEFLPSGDAFVTRQVKAAGVFWTAWRPRGKNRPHRRKLGLYAPRRVIEEATTAARRRRRVPRRSPARITARVTLPSNLFAGRRLGVGFVNPTA